MTTYLPATGFNKTSYRGGYVNAAGAGNGVQLGSLFLPDPTRWSMPPGGYPVLMSANLAGFKTTYLATSIRVADAAASLADMLRLMCLDGGIAVYEYAVTPCYDASGTVTGNPLTDANPIGLDYPANLHYGTAPLGKGVFIPLDTPKPTDYSGGTAGLHPMQEPLRDTAWRDACMALQYVWWNAPAMGVSRDWILSYGSSASADIQAYQQCGPLTGRGAQFFPGGTGQDAVNTRLLRAAYWQNWQPWMNMVSDASQIVCFAKKPASGGATTYDDVSNAPSESNRSHMRNASVVWYGTRDADILAANRILPTYITMTDADTFNAAAGPWTLPANPLAAGFTTNPHCSFGGSMLIDATMFPDWIFKMGSLSANGQNDGVIDTSEGGASSNETYNTKMCSTIYRWFIDTVKVPVLGRGRRFF